MNKSKSVYSKNTISGASIIFFLILIIYIPDLKGGFIWDDLFLTNNPLIKAKDGLYSFWLTTKSIDYYPLTYTILWLEWRLWKMEPLGYHITNVFLHIGSSIVIWRVLEKLKKPGAWLAGLVFGIHPVNVV